ncbi:MAG: DinB family protein [Phycisphaerae bacterium]
MIDLRTAQVLFAHNDWAREQLLAALGGLKDESLDQKCDIGPGSLREVMRHLYMAERAWYVRWDGPRADAHPEPESLKTLGDLAGAARQIAEQRNEWVAGFARGDFDRTIHYRTRDGAAYAHRLGDLMLHVCNHGVYHRAQAVNMLRQVGAKPLWLDFIARSIERGPQATAAELPALATIRRVFAFGDWANEKLLAAMAPLPAEKLDQSFEIGLGTLRKTLIHIIDAENWWLGNWRDDSQLPFPPPDVRLGAAEIRARRQQVSAERDAWLDRQKEADESRVVRGVPRPGVVREFPLAATAAQVSLHGTHHRAQAVNMLRRLGQTPPGLDYVLFVRERTAR